MCSMFCRLGLLRPRPPHLVLGAAQGSHRKRTGGAGLLWAAPLPVAAAAAAAGEEEGGPGQGARGEEEGNNQFYFDRSVIQTLYT